MCGRRASWDGAEDTTMKTLLRSPALYIAIAVVIVAALMPLWVSGYLLGILTVAYYFGVFSMAWDLLFGFAGEVNFGPTFLIGLGAYTAAILDNQFGPPIFVCVLAGAAVAVLGGLALAVPALRLSGPYFGLVTLVAVLLLQASGQDRIEAQALGFNVTKHKIAAFCISALFSGVAGAMLIFYMGTASVGTVIDISVGVQVIIAAVLGGRRTILGAALGSIFLILATEFLRPLGQLNTFVVSAVALAVILFFPDGLLGYVLRAGERE